LHEEEEEEVPGVWETDVAEWVSEMWTKLNAEYEKEMAKGVMPFRAKVRKFVDPNWSAEDEWKADVQNCSVDFPLQFRAVTAQSIRSEWNKKNANRIPANHILVALCNRIEPLDTGLWSSELQAQVCRFAFAACKRVQMRDPPQVQ
jgi:hypothetical protein